MMVLLELSDEEARGLAEILIRLAKGMKHGEEQELTEAHLNLSVSLAHRIVAQGMAKKQ